MEFWHLRPITPKVVYLVVKWKTTTCHCPKVGNLVWEDRDYDGLQDINEPVIPNVPIKLEYAGPDGIFGTNDLEYIYHDTTDVNGRYYFCGLIGNLDPSGVAKPTYRLIVSDPAGMTATFNNPDPSDDACVKKQQQW